MGDDGRVVTAKLPNDLVSRLDEVAALIDRSKSWMVRQALAEWVAEEQRRHDLTLEALKDVDEGRVEERKRERAGTAPISD
jgi:predicted transcriptional regulator